MATVPPHTHTFTIPNATAEQIRQGIDSGVAVEPPELRTVLNEEASLKLTKSENLADLDSAATARLNLDVWPEVRPQKFEAVGDGVANDDAAMLLWAADTSSPNKVIPAGTYNFTSDLIFPAGCRVKGKGMGISILNRTTAGTNTSALKTTGSEVWFEDFTLQGPSSAAYVTEETGIFRLGAVGTYITGGGTRGVEVKNFGAYGIRNQYTTHVITDRNYVHDVGYGGIVNLSCNNFRNWFNRIENITPGTAGNAYGGFVSQATNEPVCDGWSVNWNYIDGVPVWEGLDTHAGKNGAFIGNVIKNCKTGILVGPSTSGTVVAPDNVIVAFNILDAGGTRENGILASGHSTDQASNLAIVDNIVTGYGGDTSDQSGAILCSYLTGAKVSGNQLVSSLGAGITLVNTITDIIISYNHVRGVSGSFANRAAFRPRTGTHTGKVFGNIFDGGADPATYFVGGTTTSGLEMGDNIYRTSGGTLHTIPQSLNHTYLRDGAEVIATDANATLVPAVNKGTILHTGTLKANRTLTFGTVTNNVNVAGFRVTRTGTGAFRLVLGSTGHSLGTGEWAEVLHDGSNYYVAERGFVTLLDETISTDAAATIIAHANAPTILHTGTLTASRAITVSTAGATAGDTFEIRRTGTGAFPLVIGSLCALGTGEWCKIKYDGSAWVLLALGALFSPVTTISVDASAAFTYAPHAHGRTVYLTAAISADRAVTLSTTNAVAGDRVRFIRTAAATGAFNWNIGTGPLKALSAASTFADVEYNGSAWVLFGSGSV